MITGGQALLDTLLGFKSLADSTSDQIIIVWLNEYFGRIERDGKSFEEMGAYRDSADKVFGSVHLTRRNQDTFGRDLEEVISRKLTLQEAIKDGPFSIMTKQRLKVMQRDWFEQLDRLDLIQMTTPAENREWIIQRWSGSELLYEDWLGAEVFDAAARQMTGIELMTRFRDAPGIRVLCEEMAG